MQSPTYLPLSRQKYLVVTELADETVVYDTLSHQVHTLNATAAFIWRMCDGQTTTTEMAQRFNQRYQTDQGDDVVSYTLNQLAEKKLMDKRQAGLPLRANITRRDMMARAAVSALFVVPLIQSMLAPVPAQAQSPKGP